METITSTRNERVKHWAELKLPKGRKQQARYLIEGVRSVEEALNSGIPVEVVLIEETAIDSGKVDRILNQAVSRGIEVISAAAPVIEKIADTKTPQSTLAVAEPFQHDFDGLLQKHGKGLFLLVDRVSDPGNLGTLIRTADAVLATGVIVGSGSSDIYNPKVVRATMGSLFHLPVFEGDLLPYLSKLRNAQYRVYGTAAGEHTSLYAADLQGSLAIVIGSEAHGMHPDVLALVDSMLSLPMPGRAESLNAAVAGSIILYEALRQRSM